MYTLLLLLSFPLFAATESTDAFEKTYPRDNTFCNIKGQRIEIMLRGAHKFTEPREAGYGELLFYKRSGIKPKLLDLSRTGGETYHFFLGTSPLCSKSHGYIIDQNKAAILLLKDNKPFHDHLVIQFFDQATFAPKEHIDTNYPADKVFKSADGFVFRSIEEKLDREMGKVAIEGQSYIYQEKNFPLWINYSNRGFEVDTQVTFEKFPYKELFKSKEEFLEATGWNPEKKSFTKNIILEAVNHSLRKKCALFLDAKLKPVGSEAWKCQAR